MKSSVDRILLAIISIVVAASIAITAAFLLFTGRLNSLFEDTAVLLKSDEYALTVGSFGNDDALRAMQAKDWEKAISLLGGSAPTSTNSDLRRAYGISLYNAAVTALEESSDEHKLDQAAERAVLSLAFLENDKTHPASVARLLSSIGLRQYEKGFRDKGRAKMELARQRVSDDPYVCYLLGATMAREGYYAKAHPLLTIGCLSTDANVRKASTDLLGEIGDDVAEEANFTVAENSRFTLRYEGPPRPDVATRVLSILESESPRIGNLVGHLPGRKVEVIIYTKDEFATARNVPDWVGALFDGRIRLTLGDAKTSDARLRQIISHEFSHAAVFDFLGRSAPTWLDEGIAQVIEYGPTPSTESLRQMTGNRWAPLANLQGSFLSMNPNEASLAYGASYAAVANIIRKNGTGAIPAILWKLNEKNDLDAALRYAIGKDMAALDKETAEWLVE